jgi:hypothetical protein
MEPTKSTVRAVLPLGKARVVSKDSSGFKLALGGSTTMTISINHMHLYDIREGDLLSLYTEVLFAKSQG